MKLACFFTILWGLYSQVKALSEEHKRQLEEGGFVPLSCNANLATSTCQPWSSYVGTQSVVNELVVIDCGDCVEMDITVGTLELVRGIEIVGKLVLPDDYKIEITTPKVVVMGELIMTALRPVNGIPDIVFNLVGRNDQTFKPRDENLSKCRGGDCVVGKKSFTVAGGKVTIQGITSDTKTWTRLHNVTDDTQTPLGITLPSEGVEKKWIAGAEILITSYTSTWDSQQVRTITRVVRHDDLVDIFLNETINRPTTFVDDPEHDFSVEVALLSRNILFRGGADSNSDHGGHFWVFRTPKVVQKIDGIELTNFGQQALLGRYPIHFHVCGDVAGSVVSRNTIRESNQRCVVVHVTDNLVVRENVAFDTKAHCFMLEDGIEQGNEFLYNLGAKTAGPRRIIPNDGSNGQETDRDIPSTYWITNFDNTFVGNVAAGSEESGFWFEPLIRGRGASLYDFESNEVPLKLFKDNVAHSNQMGFRTYPAKALRAPDGSKNVLTGLKAHRNRQNGLFIHLCYNLMVEDSLFADNGQGIDIDRADFIEIVNTKIIGESAIFRQQFNLQGRFIMSDNCRDAGTLRGVQLHTFGFRERKTGASLDGLTFDGFHENTLCINGAFALTLDDTVRDERFAAFTTFNDLTFNDAVFDPINFCEIAGTGVVAHLADLDGSLSPTGSGLPGSVVSNVDQMLHFLPPRACTEITERCISYCENICFRSITYEIPTSGTSKLSLRVCRAGDPNDCIVTPSYFFTLEDDYEGRSEEVRRFSAHLPPGKFVAAFVDNFGREQWPTFVQKDYQQDFLCEGGFADSDVELFEPPVSDRVCEQLIKNGKMERLDGLYGVENWQFRFEGLSSARLKGIGFSKALAPSKQGRKEDIIQYLDSRCIGRMEGRSYQISALIKLTKFGLPYYCDPSEETCPSVGLKINTKIEKFKVATTETFSTKALNGFVRVQGTVTITSEMAQAETVRLYLQTPGDDSRLAMFVDNVSMNLLDDDTVPVCTGNMFEGVNPLDLWQARGGVLSLVTDAISGALSINLSGWNGITLNDGLVDRDCLRPGTLWEIDVRVKMTNSETRDGVNCLERLTCPYVSFELKNRLGRRVVNERSRAYLSESWDPDRNNRIRFTVALPGVTSWDGSIGDVSIGIHGLFVGVDLLVTGFAMRPEL